VHTRARGKVPESCFDLKQLRQRRTRINAKPERAGQLDDVLRKFGDRRLIELDDFVRASQIPPTLA
jgi:hypothetical protein